MECAAAERFGSGTDAAGGDFVTVYRSESTTRAESQLDLIYFDAGGGHRASATALISAARHQHRAWQITPINLRELLVPPDVIRRLPRVRYSHLYTSHLKYGPTVRS